MAALTEMMFKLVNSNTALSSGSGTLPGMDECLALADLGASINLMPFFVWEALSLPELTPTYMTLELADRSTLNQTPRVPLILGRCFLKTGRALIDVHKANYDQMTANKIDVICEIYSQEVLGFSDVTASGSPTPNDDPIVSTTSPTLTLFGDSDFLLFEEADAFLGLEDDPDSPKINPFYYDLEGDILLLEAILNSEPLPPLPTMNNICLHTRKNSRSVKPKLLNLPLMNLLRLSLRTYLPISKEDYKPAVQHQRRVNPKIHDVIKKEVEKLLDAGLIYLIYDSPWVSPVHCVSKKGGFTLVENEENELILTRLVTEWRTVSLGILKIPIDPHDQEKTTFTCPYGMFVYRRMPFDLCNASGTFQRCMLSIFNDMVEKTMEVFMDDFYVFGNSFENCLSRLNKMLQRCEDTNLSLNWEKSHFMVKEGIVLGHKISKNEIEVDKAKIDVIAKLPHPTTVKGIRCFLGHTGFYRRFIQDFSKISRPMTHLLKKNTPFIFFEDCIQAFQTLKKKLTEAPILIAPNWDLPFELMCDPSDFSIVAEILRKFRLTEGKSACTPINTEKPLLKDPDGEDVDVHTYSDYADASLDRKSTTGGCQFLRCRLISWQCKKQTVVATSPTEAGYGFKINY
nr:reverse transcriptase domain-containing protein [Tanacetum cinerariifolium]